MTRTKVIAGPEGSVTVALTKEQNDARDLEEQAEKDAEPRCNALKEIRELEGQVTQRRLREAYADSTWLDAQEALIATERAKLAE